MAVKMLKLTQKKFGIRKLRKANARFQTFFREKKNTAENAFLRKNLE